MKWFLNSILLLVGVPIAASAFEGDTVVMHRGRNTIELAASAPYSFQSVDPKMGKEKIIQGAVQMIPVSINGTPVYYTTAPNFILQLATSKITDCIKGAIRNVLDSLAPGSYSYDMCGIVVGTDGKVAWYDKDALSIFGATDNDPMQKGKLEETDRSNINELIGSALERIELDPLVMDGEKVPFRICGSIDIRVKF